MTRWSSISLTSFRASSTGCTFVRNARPKTPSNRDSIFASMFLSTVTAGVFTPPASLALALDRQPEAGGEDRGHHGDIGQARIGRQDRRQEREPEGSDQAAADVREDRRRGGEDNGFEDQRRFGGEGAPEHACGRERVGGAVEPERRRRMGRKREVDPRQAG